MMDKDTESAPFTTLDAYLSGFLVLQGCQPELIDQGGKIAFVFQPGDDLKEAIAAYHTGAKVEASLLASTTKALKGQIFTKRREKEKGHDGKYRNATE